jgi:ribonuclease PH
MSYKRSGGRTHDQMRGSEDNSGFTRYAEGSVLIEMGRRGVICTASIDDRVPLFKRGRGEGWVTAEYSDVASGHRNAKRRGKQAEFSYLAERKRFRG